MKVTTESPLTVKILALLVNGTKKGACFSISLALVFSIIAWKESIQLSDYWALKEKIQKQQRKAEINFQLVTILP